MIRMGLPQKKYYTSEDFFNMPDDIRAEPIHGEIIYMASPNRSGEPFTFYK